MKLIVSLFGVSSGITTVIWVDFAIFYPTIYLSCYLKRYCPIPSKSFGCGRGKQLLFADQMIGQMCTLWSAGSIIPSPPTMTLSFLSQMVGSLVIRSRQNSWFSLIKSAKPLQLEFFCEQDYLWNFEIKLLGFIPICQRASRRTR